MEFIKKFFKDFRIRKLQWQLSKIEKACDWLKNKAEAIRDLLAILEK